jgi:peroxiredoxin
MIRLALFVLSAAILAGPVCGEGSPSPAAAPAAAPAAPPPPSPDAHEGHEHGAPPPFPPFGAHGPPTGEPGAHGGAPGAAPGPEEKAVLEKLASLKGAPPKDDQDAQRIRKAYTAALREHFEKFPSSPRAHPIAEALAKILVGSGDIAAAEQTARAHLARASTPGDRAAAVRLLVDLFVNTAQLEKAADAVSAQVAADPTGPDVDRFTYKLAGLQSDLGRHDAAIRTLDAFIAAGAGSAHAMNFKLRAADILITARRAREAIERLEAIRKENLDDSNRALSTYLLGIAHLSLAWEAPPDAAAELRKKALSYQETLMAGTRKDVTANYPHGPMAFIAAADVLLAGGDKDGAIRCYRELARLFKGKREGDFAEKAAQDAVWIGRLAPDFTVTGLDGKPISLASHAGKVVLLAFWSTSWTPLARELPVLHGLKRSLQGKRFALIGVSVDRQPAREAVRSTVKLLRMDWPHAFDGKGAEGRVPTLYRVASLPATFVIDSQRRIVRAGLTGPHLADVIRHEVARREKGLPPVTIPPDKRP